MQIDMFAEKECFLNVDMRNASQAVVGDLHFRQLFPSLFIADNKEFSRTRSGENTSNEERGLDCLIQFIAMKKSKVCSQIFKNREPE